MSGTYEPPQVRLHVLGIAQDGGHPQAGCVQTCCMEAHRDPALGHRIACLGLVAPEGRYLVDCTPDVRAQLYALGAPPLEGILLTHAHLGHYTGLLHLGREAWAPSGIPVWVMPGMRRFLEENAPWHGLLTDGHVELRELRDGEPLRLGEELKVVPHVVPHRGPWSETVGFEIVGPRRRVLYVPDIDRWSDWSTPLEQWLERVDRAYLDGSFFDASELPHRDLEAIPHPLVLHTMERLQPLPPALRERVHFIHLNHSNPLLRPGSSAYEAVHQRGYRVAVEGAALDL